MPDITAPLIKDWYITIVPREKYKDPRYVQIDLNLPLINTSAVFLNERWGSNRVMPFNNMRKFYTRLKAKTKCIKEIDESHFWVSGYIALHFYLKDKKDRIRMKTLIKEAIAECGGFMTAEEWLAQHNKKSTKFYMFSGTGSGISGGLLNPNYAFM